MKQKLTSLIFVAALAGAAHANLYTFDFTGINAPIIDGDAAGISDTRTLGGMTGSTETPEINNVNVTLNIAGGYNGDLYGYLVHDGGFVVLLNRVGRTATDDFGYANSGFNITLSGTAVNDVHLYQDFSPSYNGSGQLTGTWQADGRSADPSVAIDTSPRNTGFSSFNGLNPNGGWTLFLSDIEPGGEAVLAGWGLQISTVPEPATCALGIFALIATAVTGVRMLRRHRRQHYNPVS